MTTEDALKWANTFGAVQTNTPSGDATALEAQAEVNKLRRIEVTAKWLARASEKLLFNNNHGNGAQAWTDAKDDMAAALAEWKETNK